MTALAVAAVRPLIAREYLRVSKDPTKRRRSTSEQHVENAREVEDLGWTLGEPYRDDDRSASRFATKVRDDYQRLVRDLREGTFGADVLVLWETSRGSREMDEWVDLVNLLEECGVLVHVTSHERTYDPRKWRDRAALLTDGIDNESESRKVSVRTRRTAASKAEEGAPTGRCPVGYSRVYSETDGSLVTQVPDPETAPMIREVFERIAAGHSIRSIANDFEERGIVNAKGTPYTPQHLRTLAKTHAYAGLRVHIPGRKDRNASAKVAPVHIYPAKWEGLVTEDLFYRVQGILDDPARRTRRPGRANHLLTMIAVCDVCGGPMIGREKSGPVLICKQGGHVTIAEPELDALAERAMLVFLGPNGLAHRIAAKEADSADLRTARAEAAGLRARLAGIEDAITNGVGDVVAALNASAKVREMVNAADQRVRDLSSPEELRGLIEPGEGVEERWEDAPLAVRRQVARLLLRPGALGTLRVLRSPKAGQRTPVSERVKFDQER